jgi:PKD repeat protein
MNGDNETIHEFSILINNTELLKDKIRDPVYQIDPAQEKITINITDLNSTLYPDRQDCFNIKLTKIYAKDPAFVRIQLFTEPVIDGVLYPDINTELSYATELPPVKNNISLELDPSFIPWSNYPQVYLTLTFNLVKNATAPGCLAYNGSRFLNNSLTSPFDYNYDPNNVTQPRLRDGVLEVETGSGYRTISGALIQPLAAKFKYSIQSGTPNFNVKFTDQSTGSPVDWEWDFTNDGTVDSTLNNPSNSYGAPGIYNVKLTVKDAAGVSASTTQPIDLSAPIAGFSGTPVSGNEPLNVQFTDTSTGGSPSSWKWEYNRTIAGSWTLFNTTQNPLNTFTGGTYDIRLTVTNLFGSNNSTKPSYITAIPPAPVASFNTAPSPATGNAPLVVTFTDTSTGGSPDIWDWDFGDGSPHSNVQNPPAHTYTVAGFYTAQLTVSNAGGSSSATKPVTAYTVVSFTTIGTTSWTAPAGVTSIEYLVVAGGGGGGRGGAGGGAGGFRTASGYAVIPTTSYTVTVGAGGAGGTAGAGNTVGKSGSNSVFATITANGGGGGGGRNAADYNGLAGGSGGGATRTGAVGTGNQGNNGGLGLNTLGGGGGGAFGIGANAIGTTAGNGGAGTASSITGVSVTYAGGGGGGAPTGSTNGLGGSGGGGNGAVNTAVGSNGIANRGGGAGGGGEGSGDGGAGGSGIVIIKYY